MTEYKTHFLHAPVKTGIQVCLGHLGPEPVPGIATGFQPGAVVIRCIQVTV